MIKFRRKRAEETKPADKAVAPVNVITLEDEVINLKGYKEILQYAIDNDYKPNRTQMTWEDDIIIFTNRSKPSISYDLRKDQARVLIPDSENMSLKRAMFLFLDKANAYGYYPRYGLASLAPYFMQYAYGALTGELMLSEEFIVYGSTTSPESVVNMTYSYYNSKASAERYAKDHSVTMEAAIVSRQKDYFRAAEAVNDAIWYAIFMVGSLELTTKRHEVNKALNHGYADRVPSYHFIYHTEEVKRDVNYIIDKIKAQVAENESE